MLQFLCRRRKCDGGVDSSTCKELDSKLLKWMVDERWDKVFQFLSKQSYNINSGGTSTSSRNRSDYEEKCNMDCERSIDLMNVGQTGHNILHLSCMFHPPIPLVEAILVTEPSAISKLNSERQYPLHLAAQYGAAPEVIGLLIDHFPNALRHQDIHGQSPLHKVCQSYADNYKACCLGNFANTAFGITRKEEDVQDAIQMITRGCPAVANLEDNEHCNALEYALTSEHVNLATIKCIQRACSRTWRKSIEDAKKSQNRRSRQTIRRVCADGCIIGRSSHDYGQSSYSDPGPAGSSKERTKTRKKDLHGSLKSIATASTLTCEILDFHASSRSSSFR